jgi:hypothetical protein
MLGQLQLKGLSSSLFKESRMENLANTGTEKSGKVSLEVLAKMTGFPVDMIKEEIFRGQDADQQEVSLDDLRAAMLSYIDSTMLIKDDV